MTTSLLFSRVRMRRDAPSRALAELFLPQDEEKRISVAHKLLWTLFADSPDRRRDFLWRESKPGEFYLLSSRMPRDSHNLFDLDFKDFSPALTVGDRLGFSLRANPTVARKSDAKHSKRSDVVMDAIKSEPSGKRAEARRAAIQEQGEKWLRRQAERDGFAIEAVQTDRYNILRPKPNMKIATLDFEGKLRVADGFAFLTALSRGFGRAKTFGCGLMLIRRV
jgi:CRISPR system Cascade subunit CasE